MAIVETTLAEQLKAQGIEDGVEDIAVLLQPLLEQEAQLEWVFFFSFPFLLSLYSVPLVRPLFPLNRCEDPGAMTEWYGTAI
jgi:hypothetical protein